MTESEGGQYFKGLVDSVDFIKGLKIYLNEKSEGNKSFMSLEYIKYLLTYL